MSFPSWRAGGRRPRLHLTGLWRHADFVRFWTGDTISLFGSMVTQLAIPLIAVLTLHASPFAVGAVAAAGQAPSLLFGLPVGAWVDRFRRRPVMIASDVGRAVLLLAIPIAAWLDVLSVPLLCAVTFATGTLTLTFGVASMSYLPTLLRQDQLADGNRRIEISASTAQVAGPGLGGILVGLLTAPFAILLDAIACLISASFVFRIEAPEPRPARSHDENLWREIREGVRHVVHDPILRAMAGSSAAVNFFGYAFMAVYILFMSRELDLGASAIGLVFATGGVGALIGALVSPRVTAWLGVGPTMLYSQLAFGLWGLLVPAALLFPRVEVPLVVAAEFLQWMALIIYAINAVTLRQTITPGHLYGRVNATFRFVSWGLQPLGSLLGGFLGGVIGLPWTLVLGVVGMMLAVLPLARSPLRHGRGDHLVAGSVNPRPEVAQVS